MAMGLVLRRRLSTQVNALTSSPVGVAAEAYGGQPNQDGWPHLSSPIVALLEDLHARHKPSVCSSASRAEECCWCPNRP